MMYLYISISANHSHFDLWIPSVLKLWLILRLWLDFISESHGIKSLDNMLWAVVEPLSKMFNVT